MLQTQATKATERALSSIARNADLSAMQMVKLRLQLGDTSGAFKQLGTVATTGFTRLYRSVFNLKTAIAGLGLTYLIKDIFEAGRSAEALDVSFKAVFGSTQAAQQEFGFLRKTADDLGQNFWDLADSYKGVSAASKDTVLEGKATRDIFQAVTEASSALQLFADQTKGALVAISQMISKGKVSAEELRQQLGERLPGRHHLAHDGRQREPLLPAAKRCQQYLRLHGGRGGRTLGGGTERFLSFVEARIAQHERRRAGPQERSHTLPGRAARGGKLLALPVHRQSGRHITHTGEV